MSNWIKYGRYYIAAGIAVTGVLWFNRPSDMRVKGEDVADLYEAEAERSVITALTGTDTPDFDYYNSRLAAAPSGGTNTVDSRVRYADISTIAERIRHSIQRGGNIFWTSDDITNGQQIAESMGSWSVTNTVYNNAPYGITNVQVRTYSYSTNSFKDMIVTSGTRLWNPGSLFEYRDGLDGSVMTKTNLPVSNLVYGRGTAFTCQTNSLRNGSWWPLQRTYTFPWEQWNDVDRIRVTLESKAGASAATNVLWITTNSPALSLSFTNSAACFSVAAWKSVQGWESVPFTYIGMPPNNNGLYLSAYSYSTAPGEFSYIDVRVRKGSSAYNAEVSAAVVYGDSSISWTPSGQGYYYTDFAFWPKTNATSAVIKFTASNTNIAPVYCKVSWSNATAVMTNDYFDVTKELFISEAITGMAKEGAFLGGQLSIDDMRINTNKLYSLAHVLTNLHRTVCVGATVTPTNSTGTMIYKGSPISGTNYVLETTSGTGYTPSYYTGYDMGDILADLLETDGQTDVSYSPDASLISTFDFHLDETKTAKVYESPDVRWDAYVKVFGYFRITEMQHNGCTLSYPADWAVTNGYVKRVRVFALVETDGQEYGTERYPLPVWSYTNTVSGSLWYAGNLGIESTNCIVNLPDPSIDTTISNTNTVAFSSSGDLGFCGTSRLTLVYDVSDPTNRIMFDMPAFSFTHCTPGRYTLTESAQAGPAELRREASRKDYSVYYRVKVSKWVVLVDWNFKHLGNGFTPETNSPAWMQ
jgi:hypothetical protein